MLYTYALKIVYVRHFKTKVERQCVIRWTHIEPSACVCILALLKRSVLSIFLNVMVVWGSFVVVVVIKK